MAYTHGVHASEVATSLVPSVEVSAGIPMIFGTAPVGMTDATNVNKPVLCYTYAEAVAAFGYVPPVEDGDSGLKKFEYTISEFINCAFSQFGISPVIIVNVLDPAEHKLDAETTSVTLGAKTGYGTVGETGIIADTVEVKNGETAYVKDTDYTLSYDDDGYLVVTSLLDDDGNYLCAVGTELTFSAEKTDPTQVTSDDIVGGVDTDGNKSGLELVEDVFPLFRLNAGTLIAPGFSDNATVASVMSTKCDGINSVFKAICAVDVPTDTVKQYSSVANWKNSNNVVDENQIVCWPLIELDGVVYHMSTQLACLLPLVDSENSDVPYVSPSNQGFKMTGLVLTDGTEVTFGQDTGAYLNSQGIVTALNFINGWVCWGNRTACYPSNTDVKDAFIPIRRMFVWVNNTLVQTYWQRVDAPLNRRQVDTIVDSVNIWLNGLAARQFILGGRLEFLDSENTTTDLMDGKATFHLYITPPSPNREIEFVLEYDTDYLETLFG